MPTVAIGLITAVGFAIRLSQIRQGLYGDELTTYSDVVGRSLGSTIRNVNAGGENSPPLFFILSWLSAKLGDPTVWIRLPSLILGTATLPLVYLIGRDAFGRVAGLAAAALLAVSPFAMYYSVEARPYSTMAFFVALSTLALISAVRTGSVWWWVAYVLASAAAAYSHYTSIFVLVTQVLWSLWVCRHRVRAPLIAAGLIAVLYVPWLPHLRGKFLAVIGFLHPLTFPTVLTDIVRTVLGQPDAPLSAIPGIAGLAVFAGCAVLCLLAFARHGRGTGFGDPSVRAERIFIAALAIVTPVGLLLYSLLASDLWLPRGLYASLPSVALLFGALLTVPPRRLAAVAVAVGIVIMSVGSAVATTQRWARPPYREIAAHLDDVAGPNDPIISYPSFVGFGVTPYLQRRHSLRSVSAADWRSVRSGARVYVLIYDPGGYGFNRTIPNPAGFRLIARRQYQGITPTDLLTYERLS